MSLAPQPFEAQARYHPRVESDLMAKVLLNGRAILAKVRDLSMAGLSLAGDPTLGRDRLTLSLPLPNDREIVAECRVCRREETTVGLEFEHLDWDDLFALARYLHPRLP